MPRPFAVLPEERAQALNVVGEKLTILASFSQTQGSEFFFQDGKKGDGPPPHSHDWDESFYVIQGNIQFGFDAGKPMLATSGTLVHIPAQTEHWFKFDSETGQMLSVTGARSGAAAFFTQVDADVADGSDIEGLVVVADKHQLKITLPE